jgi:hypothetical protein
MKTKELWIPSKAVNEKRQLEAGATGWVTWYYLRGSVSQYNILSRKKAQHVKPHLKYPLVYLD